MKHIGHYLKQVTKGEGAAPPGPAPVPPAAVTADPDAPPVGDAVAPVPSSQGEDGGTSPSRWRAFIDRITINSVEGWVIDTHNPAASVTVEAITSSGKTAMAVAHLFRQDVQDAGYGDGRCGFFLDLSKLDVEGETAIVRVAGSKHPLTGEAIDFDPSRAVLATELPSSYKAIMEFLAAQTFQAAEAAGVSS